MIRKAKAWMGLFLFFFTACSLLGQEQVLLFNRLSSDLTSQSDNYWIFKDSEGFVWISSVYGLNRFNGENVKHYPSETDKGWATDKTVTGSFFEDKAGNLWFCTHEGLINYDKKKDCFTTHSTQEAGNDLKLLHFDKEKGKIWMYAGDCLFTYSTEKGLVEISKPGSYHGVGIRLFLSGKPHLKYLCLPKNNGVQIFGLQEGVVWEKSYPQKKLPGFRTSAFFLENDSTLWAGADTGLVRINLASEDGDIRIYSNFNGTVLRAIQGIVPWGQDNFIVATNKQGLYCFDKKNTLRFTHRILTDVNGRIEPFLHPIDQIYMDADSTLWISTSGKGIFYTHLPKRKFPAYLQASLNVSSDLSNVTAMSSDEEERIWCLTRKGVAVIDSRGHFIPGFEKLLDDQVPFRHAEPFHILCTGKQVFVTAQNGVFYLNSPGEGFKKVDGSGNTPFIYQLMDGRILTSTYSKGILEVFQNNGSPAIRPFPELEDKPGGYTMIYETSGHTVFFCRDWKEILVYHFEGKNLQYDTTLALDAAINGIAEDKKNGKVWFATSNGLHWLNSKKWDWKLHRDTALPDRILHGILPDKEGNLWISFSKGLYRYHPDSGKWRAFKLADGLQSLEFNFWSALKINDSLFAFGGVNGVNIFNPYAIRDLETKAKPVITGVFQNGVDKLSGRWVTADATPEELVFKFSKEPVTFHFAAMEYSDPEANQFQLQLTGFNDNPIPAWTNNTIPYPNLREGKYTFKVMAYNSDGVLNEEDVAEVTIRILPPLHRTWWFRSLALLLLLSLAYAYYRFRITQIRKEEAFKRKEAEFRQKEAEIKQQMAETETAILRLQMNPHFIFNSMNSINSYILQKDIDTASEYLGRFAKLMRMILKFSAKPFITVSEEKDLLEQYLQTEAMRFERKFSYRFEVGEELDSDETILPTMILQPFVENAIWHGLSNKEGEGRVVVSFQRQDGSLVCSVEDNGLGREAALTKEASKAHESKALSITARRLELLEKEAGASASYEIIDLKDAAGLPRGTKVVLKLPFL